MATKLTYIRRDPETGGGHTVLLGTLELGHVELHTEQLSSINGGGTVTRWTGFDENGVIRSLGRTRGRAGTALYEWLVRDAMRRHDLARQMELVEA